MLLNDASTRVCCLRAHAEWCKLLGCDNRGHCSTAAAERRAPPIVRVRLLFGESWTQLGALTVSTARECGRNSTAPPSGRRGCRASRGRADRPLHTTGAQRERREIDKDGQFRLGQARCKQRPLRPVPDDLRSRRLGDAHVRRAEEAEGAVAEAADYRGCVDKSVAWPARCSGSRKTRARRGPFGLWARPRSCSPTTRRRPGRTGRGKGTCFFGRGFVV